MNSKQQGTMLSGEWREDPGDEIILARAYQQKRVLVTLDKDFGALGELRHLPHCGIIRLVNFRSSDQGPVCVRVLASHGKDLHAASIITVEAGRVRIRYRSDPQV